MKTLFQFSIFIFLLGLGVFLLDNSIFVVGQNLENESNTITPSITRIETNPLELYGPIYQAVTGIFITTKEISSIPYAVTEESLFEEAVMKDIGNATNNMTFTNTYLSEGLIQWKGKGTIRTSDGQMFN